MHYIIYDLEATCWLGRPPGSLQEIIEIGAMKLNGYGEELGKFSRFVKPKINPRLSAFCTELTTIKQSDIDMADGFEKVVEDFQDWINIFEDDYVLCSWGKFDKTMLQADCILHDIESDWVDQYINLKQQYQDMKGLRRPAGLKSVVVKEGFEFTGMHHRGIADAENLAKVFTKYIDEWIV